MKKINLIAIVGLAVLALTSCKVSQGDGKQVERNVNVKALGYFNKISGNLPCDIYYVQGNEASVKIVGTEDNINDIKVSNNNGTLTFTYTNNKWRSLFPTNSDARIYISSPDLVRTDINGTGDFTVDKELNSDTLEINISGMGDVDLSSVICDKFTVNLKGTGDVDIASLTCVQSEINLRGTGDIDVYQYNVDTTTASLKGTGDVNIKAKDCGEITCSLLGTGDITVSGNAKRFDHSQKGTGDINYKDLTIRP